MDPRYSVAVQTRFRDTSRAGSLPGENPEVGTGEASSAGSAERVRLQIRVDADGRIARARFKAFGCPATIACAAYTAERIEGGPAQAALEAAEIIRELALGDEHAALAELPLRALAGALSDQRAKRPSRMLPRR